MFQPSADPPPPAGPDSTLWLALALPDLPLQAGARLCAEARPWAITENARVLHANGAARAAGVEPGLKLNAAQALAPTLLVQPRDAAAERRALRQLAAWTLQFTPLVSLQSSSGLVLEIGASLRLFGGLKPLLTRFRQGLNELGYHARLGVAPTPGGAWLLAQAGESAPVLRLSELRPRLEPLPLALLELAPKQAAALQGLGADTLGACLRLPRAGLARRIGPELPRQLDRILGLAPDPRRPYLPPPRFHAYVDLPTEVEHTPPLLFVFKRLLGELCGFLRGLDSGTQRLEIGLRHAEAAPSTITLGLVEPSREPEHLLGLLSARLERLALPAPVRAVELKTVHLQSLAPQRPELLGDPGRPQHAWTHLVERLRARLGDDAVRGLAVRSSHRPEDSWAYVAPGTPSPVDDLPQGERPLWLLPQPQALRLKGHQPIWRGPLVMEQGPERIETGWWDGGDICRDYYIARNPAGSRLWVYLDRRSQTWFLHGLFS